MIKRVFDLAASSAGLIVFSPVSLIFAALIKLEDGGPVFYRGVRVGRNGRPFRIFKFRTMVRDAETVGGSSTSGDDSRITRVGRFLRRYKLDELPQLLNVLWGDMSMVGPRPQVPWAVAGYSETERELLKLRPGITDYASLRFHNEGEILRGTPDPDATYMEKIHPEKMRLALRYAREQSFLLDCKILVWTLLTICGAKPFAGESADRSDIPRSQTS
ncbi:MAG: sugar transferase [Acidobacteria bacterium]|nr:sugar transferase [Acidobacteriota bacterium]